jgi:hypothetical protein
VNAAWIELDSAEAIEHFSREFHGFHDACLREVHLSTENYVDSSRSMSCPAHLDTTIWLFLQSQGAALGAVEIQCRQVTRFRVTPSGDGCDSVITFGSIKSTDGALTLSLYFIGAPLGPTKEPSPTRGANRPPDIEVVARELAWRPLPNSLGNVLRYAGK